MEVDRIMKALSLKQPWANMIASGIKTIELRKWTTKYRGPILIISSKIPNIEPAGMAIAVAYLSDCRPATIGDRKKACHPIYPGAKAWIFSMVYKIKIPFKVKGQLSLFNVEYEPKVSDLKSVY